MSLYDRARDALFDSQEDIYSDEILFKDGQGGYTISHRGIYKEQYEIVDSITQQHTVTQAPVLWIRLPAPVRLSQGQKLKFNNEYFGIDAVQNDYDNSCANLILYRTAP